MIAFAAVAMAACANAAALDWGLSTLVATEDGTGAAAGNIGYFMAASTWDAFSALDADKVAAFCEANYTYSAVTTAGRAGAVLTATSGTYNAGDVVSGYIVLFDTAAAADAAWYANTGVTTATVPSVGNAGIQPAFATGTSGWQSTAAVPEPTSGLLMLVGLAGLALRRRRA